MSKRRSNREAKPADVPYVIHDTNIPSHDVPHQASVFARAMEGTYPHTEVLKGRRDPDRPLDPLDLLDALPKGTMLTRTSVEQWDNLIATYEGPSFVVVADLTEYGGTISIAAASWDLRVSLSKRLKKALSFHPSPQDTVPIRVWGAGDIIYWDRKELVSWESVEQNYTEKTRIALSGLMAQTEDTQRAGKIILWHGEPGTGKSWALRALLTSWRSWCKADFILDPEAAFDNPKYVADLLHRSDDGYHLFICEDADNLVSSRHGREGRLERILQMSDGILGQDSKVLFLITTNDAPEHLDPAISRPGRCFANIGFTRFTLEETKERLEGTAIKAKGPMTLAETFNATRDEQQIKGKREIEAPGQYL